MDIISVIMTYIINILNFFERRKKQFKKKKKPLVGELICMQEPISQGVDSLSQEIQVQFFSTVNKKKKLQINYSVPVLHERIIYNLKVNLEDFIIFLIQTSTEPICPCIFHLFILNTMTFRLIICFYSQSSLSQILQLIMLSKDVFTFSLTLDFIYAHYKEQFCSLLLCSPGPLQGCSYLIQSLFNNQLGSF